jgi:hypothetical protein
MPALARVRERVREALLSERERTLTREFVARMRKLHPVRLSAGADS